MFDIPISKMNDKQLRDAVQLLYDELAMFKRKYEDAINNLDSSNFSKSFTIEQNNMKTQIKITAKGLESTVSVNDLATELTKYSTIEQTAGALRTVVSKSADLGGAEEISDIAFATDRAKVYKIPKYNGNTVVGETYYYYNDLTNSWEILSGENIYTMFEQTDEGFRLKGNTVIDGDTVITRNLVLSGNVTWAMENSPVQTQYSSDGSLWHAVMMSDDIYMRMSFDGGATWSTTTKVVGTDGRDGEDGLDGEDGRDGRDGSDANVTAENVFNALTNDGATQGLFSAFYKNESKLFINAEYISAGTLRGTVLANGDGTYGLQMSSDPGTGEGVFRLYRKNINNSDLTDGTPYFSVYDDGLGVIQLYGYGKSFLQATQESTEITVTPKGTWDFSACTIENLSAKFG